MDFELSEDERSIRDLAREVATQEIAPNAAAWDREERFPRELVSRLGELGLLGTCVPAELGGAGASFVAYIAEVWTATVTPTEASARDSSSTTAM